MHEAHGLHALQPGCDEALDELRAPGRLKRVGLVLQPVPRPDVGDEDAHQAKPYAVTCSSLTRTMTRCSPGLRP
jgi:hypothetical protein